MIVGIAGPKRSGKNTLADIIGWPQVAFADHLREVAAEEMEVDPEWFHEISTDQATKEVPHPDLGGESPREVLIRIGAAVRRIEPGYWTHEGIRRALAAGPSAVITDVRYFDEAEAVRGAGGVVVGLVRESAWDPTGPEAEAHAVALDADIVARNDGTVQDLEMTWMSILVYLWDNE